MTKLKFDILSLNQIIKPSIQSTIDSLKAITTDCSFTIPKDFEHSQFLYDLDDEIKQIITELTNYKDWLSKSTESIENAVDELNRKASTIEEIIVTKNEHIVNIN